MKSFGRFVARDTDKTADSSATLEVLGGFSSILMLGHNSIHMGMP